MLEGRASIQRTLVKPEKWADRNHIKLTKASVKSCIWEEITPCSSTSWWLFRKQLCRKVSGSPGGQQVEHKSAGPGKWSFPSIWHLHLEYCVQLGLPSTRRMWHPGSSPAGATKGAGERDLQEESERSGLFSLEKRGLERAFCCLQLFDQRIQRKWSQTLLGSVQR